MGLKALKALKPCDFHLFSTAFKLFSSMFIYMLFLAIFIYVLSIFYRFSIDFT